MKRTAVLTIECSRDPLTAVMYVFVTVRKVKASPRGFADRIRSCAGSRQIYFDRRRETRRSMTDQIPLQREREQVGDLGREMLAQQLTKGTGGNVSIRNGDRFAVSPSGVAYESVKADAVPVVDMHGEQIAGDLKPSSETPMHALIYRDRSDVGSVIHTHSPYASTFASLADPIPASHYLIAYVGTEIPVCDYAPPGTKELGRLAAETMGDDHDAVLLKNHGAIGVGETGDDALNVAMMVEFCARIHYQARSIGEPELLPDETVTNLRRMFDESYGQQEAGE